MNKNEAIEIINEKRISNPFTMGLSLDEYIKRIRTRHLRMTNELLPIDYIGIAKLMIDNNKKDLN